MTATVTVHLVRHGQSVWNADGRLQGQRAHIPLTHTGVEQSHAAARELAARIDGQAVLWSSDLVRARQTADVISEALALPIHVDPLLREQSYGSLEGAPVTEPLPDHDGETTEAVVLRVCAFFAGALPGNPQHLIVVSHGETLRAAAEVLTGGRTPDVSDDIAPNGSVRTHILTPTAVHDLTAVSSGPAQRPHQPEASTGRPSQTGKPALAAGRREAKTPRVTHRSIRRSPPVSRQRASLPRPAIRSL